MAVWTSFPLSFFFNRISFRIRRHGFSLCLPHYMEIVSSRKKSPSSNTRELSFPRAIIFPLVDGCSRIDNRWTLKIRSIEFIITKVAVPATTRMERITHFTYWTESMHGWLGSLFAKHVDGPPSQTLVTTRYQSCPRAHEWKHISDRDRLKIGLRIDEVEVGVSLERGRTRKGFNYPRVHYFPREGRYLKIRRAIGTAKGSMQRSEYTASS